MADAIGNITIEYAWKNSKRVAILPVQDLILIGTLVQLAPKDDVQGRVVHSIVRSYARMHDRCNFCDRDLGTTVKIWVNEYGALADERYCSESCADHRREQFVMSTK